MKFRSSFDQQMQIGDVRMNLPFQDVDRTLPEFSVHRLCVLAVRREGRPGLLRTAAGTLLRLEVSRGSLLPRTAGRVQRADSDDVVLLRRVLQPAPRGGLLSGLLVALPGNRAERHVAPHWGI